VLTFPTVLPPLSSIPNLFLFPSPVCVVSVESDSVWVLFWCCVGRQWLQGVQTWYLFFDCVFHSFYMHIFKVSCLISPFCRIIFHHLSLLISALCSCKYQLFVPVFTAITCFWLPHFQYGFHITYINDVPWYLCQKSVWILSYIYIYIHTRIFYSNDCVY